MKYKTQSEIQCCANSRVKPLFHSWSCRYNKCNTNPCMFEKTYKCCFNTDSNLCGLVARKRTPVLKVLCFRQTNFRMKTSKCIVLLSCLMKSELWTILQKTEHIKYYLARTRWSLCACSLNSSRAAYCSSEYARTLSSVLAVSCWIASPSCCWSADKAVWTVPGICDTTEQHKNVAIFNLSA